MFRAPPRRVPGSGASSFRRLALGCRGAVASWVLVAASIASFTASFTASLTASATALAVTPPEAARAAYARAAVAYDRGDFNAAATDFALADELVPNPVTLEVAIKAAIKADAPGLGMELVERSKRAPVAETLAQSVEAARQKFASRAAPLAVRCAPPCALVLDGRVLDAGIPRWVTAGDHSVQIDTNAGREVRVLHVAAGALVEVDVSPAPAVVPPSPPGSAAETPAPPAPQTPPAPVVVPDAAPRKGISPAWFGVAAGVTGVAGAFAIGFGVDTLSKHSTFQQTPNAANQTDGQNAQLITNVMIGVTAAAGVATVAIGVLGVQWRGSASRSASPSPSPISSVSVGVSGTQLTAAARF